MIFDTLQKPYVHIIINNEIIKNTYFSKFMENDDETLVVRTIEGKKCTALDDMFKEFATKLSFPDYFGYNWAAFDECINDLRWLPSKAYILMIYDSDSIEASCFTDFRTLIKIMMHSINEWTQGRNFDNFPTPPTPFHIYFFHSTEIKNLIELIKDAGIDETDIDIQNPSPLF